MLADTRILIAWLLLASPVWLGAQIGNVILLNNPSFEGFPIQGRQPSGWFNCGFINETPPDVQPGFFSVQQKANNGATYLGLVVRDNETYESVGQRLSMDLVRNHCYEMNLYLCHSDNYWSRSKKTNQEINFDEPVMMRLWGGYGFCDHVEKLAEEGPVNHTEWKKYTVEMRPLLGNYTHLTIEAFYKPKTAFAYNGNLLVDNLSYIREIPCPTPAPPGIVALKKVTVKPDSNSRVKPTEFKTTALPQPAPIPEIPLSAPVAIELPQAKKTEIIKKHFIRAKMLYFEINQFDIPEEYESYLETLAQNLKTTQIMIEAGGHTNNNAADKFAVELSEKRAKSVADRLIQLGAPPERVTFKGYGKTQPLDSNLAEKGREKNQRVEIKIWKTAD